MPIVGAPLNVSDYSHSTVFTTVLPSVVINNVPPLTKIYTPSVECVDRWMLVDNTQGTTTFVQTLPAVGTTETRIVPADETITNLFPAPASAPTPVAGPVKRDNAEPQPVKQAFNLTVWSIDSNPLFTSCQPYSSQSLYSPGVCPDGQTVAEITEVHANYTTGGVLTSWVASCCRSGMTFGSDVQRYCISSISTPFRAHALVTRSFPSMLNGISTFSYSMVYEYVTATFAGTDAAGNSVFSTFTVSNITTISSALAVADPIRVAWQLEDLAVFPTAYAASLGSKIGASPTPRVQTVPDLPRETSKPPASQELSTASKAGIGVGSVLGAIIIATAIILLWMRSRRKRSIPMQESTQVPEMEDQDGNLAKRKWFLGGRWRSEAHAERTAQELDSKTVHVVPGPPAELEAHNYSQDTSHSQ